VRLARFWLSVGLFHVVLIPLCVWIGRRWARRVREPHSAWAWTAALAGDAALLAAGACAWAAVCARLGPGTRFLFLRLLAQALFGEAVLLCAGAAVLHARRRLRLRAAVLTSVTLGLLAAYAEAYHRGPRALELRRHELDRSGGRRPSGRLRILHLTDLQTHEIGAHEEEAFRRGLAERPDLIVLTGDYIHERLARTGEQAVADLRALVRRVALRAPLGVFATDGDTGYDCETTFAGTDVACLVNEARRIPLAGGRSLVLVGVDTSLSHGGAAARLRRVVDAAPPADLRIVMGHAPDFVANLAGRTAVDLALAGHTHGGQVVIPFFGPPLTFSRLPRRYAGDLHDYRGIPLHVSRGIGMERGSAPQIRFLCPPEVCLVDVRY
jgi:hypothetical protein